MAEMTTVDFSQLTCGTRDERSKIVREIGRACEERGFFALVNHGVPASLRAAVTAAMEDFFALPAEEREEYMGKQLFDPIRHGAGRTLTADGFEYRRDFLRIFVHPTLHSPVKPLHFSAICEEYGRKTREIAHELLRAIWESLDLEEGFVGAIMDVRSGHQILIGNSYPSGPGPNLGLGLPAHSDIALLSIVMQEGSTSGLQVFHQGHWNLIEFIPDSLLVHVGDLLEIVSNGKYKSLLHRVTLNSTSARMSIVTAIGPNPEDRVVPLPELVRGSGSSSAKFRSIKYIEFVELTARNPFDKAALNLVRLCDV
ncbi:Leucoanthocyanidin dioxygenase [Apostasia shenzhenica]|uniref:Leucoanthocyanidin dioxygenase n=1 Tax=Apostasia shenzhenica TaxID=1088818 RepID=A0A2I0A3B9_9ASPA|nr:Leucoanthocyanidin dioxygenase [Apostasia shenzhenica]